MFIISQYFQVKVDLNYTLELEVGLNYYLKKYRLILFYVF